MRRAAAILWWHRYLSRNSRPWQELDQFAALAPEPRRAVLASRLLETIRYFGTRGDALPEWREAARIDDPLELWRAWPHLPVLSKKILRTRFDPAEIQQRFGIAGRIDSTGGSTGEPVRFLHDPLMQRTGIALGTYTRVRMGWRPGMATVIVWGSERDIGKQTGFTHRVNNSLLRDHLVDGYNLTAQTMDRVVDLIRRERPVAIYGFTSMLEYVARQVLESGCKVPPGWVAVAWNGGEMLFSSQAEIFQKAFGVPILNRYGGRELSTMACQYAANGPLHILRPWVFLEVVTDEGRPVSPGETGRVLCTSTVCRGTPFLRYDIEDLAVFADSHQDESGIAQLHQLQGRVAGLLKLPGGMKINNIFWNHLFKEFPEIRQFQVVVRRRGDIHLLFTGAGFTPDREASVRGILSSFLREIPFEISWVERIPLTPQGKLVQVIHEPV